jgi:anti-anti-sigma factor
MSTEWLSPSVVRISVVGDVDASNAADLAHYVFRRGANSQRLIIDLSAVTFFATAGFSTLRTIDSRCTQASVSWTILTSRAVRRVLRICDPRNSLPVTGG